METTLEDVNRTSMINRGTSDKKNIAMMRISNDYLANLLLLPDGAHIVRVWEDSESLMHQNEFCILVEHPDLPLHRGGERILEINPTMRNVYTPRFESWGIK